MISAAEINESILCVLIYDKYNNRIDISSVPIKNTLTSPVKGLQSICSSSLNLDTPLAFIKKTKEFEVLSKHFSFCTKLSNAYEGVNARNQSIEEKVKEWKDLIEFNKKHGVKNFDPVEAVRAYKNQIGAMYELWAKAYAIEGAYQECRSNSNVLAFSHRLCGWSNPVRQLTPNFSVEIKTNFGYGSVSYFYTKLKYKNIEILPYSDWVNYEYSYFAEIVRYTRKYQLANSSWLDAMMFCKESSNLSLTDEEAFLSKYVVAECERMVAGLEKILTEESFTFRSGQNQTYRKDKKGDVLMEFRAEKISGALDFVSKILQFKNFASIMSFIRRIEDCNKKIQPILLIEITSFAKKLTGLEMEMAIAKPKYMEAVEKSKQYDNIRNELKAKVLKYKGIKPEELDFIEFNKMFVDENPGFVDFEKNRVSIFATYRVLTQQIANTKKVLDAVRLYHQRIVDYFRGK